MTTQARPGIPTTDLPSPGRARPSGPINLARRFHQLTAFSGDTIVILAAVVIAFVGRNRLGWFYRDNNFAEVTIGAIPFIVLVWLAGLWLGGTYASSRLTAGASEYGRMMTSSAVVAGLIGIYCFLTKFELSRGFFLLLFLIGVPMLLLERFALRRYMHRAHIRGRWRAKVLVAGMHPHIEDVVSVIERESWLGFEVVGALSVNGDPSTTRDFRVGALEDVVGVVSTLKDVGADAVVFTEGAFPSPADFRWMAWELEEADVQMIVVPGLSDISAERLDVRPVGGLPLVYVEKPQARAASTNLKRAFDIVGAVAALILLSPIMIVTALAVRLADHGPIFFRQTRVGRDGKTFSCLKFRSMVVDAEDLLASIEHLNMGDGVLFKSDTDPRITGPGRFIRRFSIDELPQLFNVLRGDMSLIGPRPPLPREVLDYQDREHRRLRVRPGMTGLWQVSGRSDLSWSETIRLDLYYVDNWSMLQDLQILTKTVRAVLGGRGAY
ncbi:MAG: sugar transferase [Nostocoides sp.]